MGVTGVLFLAYLFWGTAARDVSAQQRLSNELNQQWSGAPARGDAVGARPEQFNLATGEPFAFITVPAFGPHWRFTLIQGTALAQLDVSPRPWHPVVARLTGQLRGGRAPGDGRQPVLVVAVARERRQVNIETKLNDYTYRVIGEKEVTPADTSVLAPVPGHPAQHPARRLITLITCDPAWTGTHRVIVTGVLVSARPR